MSFQCIGCGVATSKGNPERELCTYCLIDEIYLKQQYRVFCKKFNFNPFTGERIKNVCQ